VTDRQTDRRTDGRWHIARYSIMLSRAKNNEEFFDIIMKSSLRALMFRLLIASFVGYIVYTVSWILLTWHNRRIVMFLWSLPPIWTVLCLRFSAKSVILEYNCGTLTHWNKNPVTALLKSYRYFCPVKRNCLLQSLI